MNDKLNIKYISSFDNRYYYIGAMLDGKLIGHLIYKLNKDEAWLHFVGVKKSYRHLKEEQVGSNLMRIFENDCHNHRIWRIEGKFWPKGEKCEVVKRFYDRNGYEIDRDGYDLLIFKFTPNYSKLSFDVEEIEYEKFDVLLNDYLQMEDDLERE